MAFDRINLPIVLHFPKIIEMREINLRVNGYTIFIYLFVYLFMFCPTHLFNFQWFVKMLDQRQVLHIFEVDRNLQIIFFNLFKTNLQSVTFMYI